MTVVYDNWGRLVAAVIKKQQLWELCLQHSRTPSTCSEASESSSEVPFGDEGSVHICPRPFTFRELAAATENFRPELILRKGGFGVLYKGRLEDTKQAVSIISNGNQGYLGNRRFLIELLVLSLLHHPNVVDLIGYCADGDQKLLVHEYMPYGSLHGHLHDLKPEKTPLDWNTRMKIAAGVAKCLEYMHDMANPPVIHRNVKSLNVLLGEGYHPKLSNFGLATLEPIGGKTHVPTNVMGTFGYCAPEYARTGLLSVKADVYSYGVVLLEIITGREVTDISRAIEETNLVDRIRLLHQDSGKLVQMADPMLQGRFPIRSLYQALDIAATCLQTDPDDRPSMAHVATVVNYITSQNWPLETASS